MALPSQQPDDAALVDEIIRSIPDAGDAKRVRSLLAAWWRYAGVRNAAGAVVDSERFLAERSSLGLLEMPVAIARTVIELEFALLHNRKPVPPAEVALPPAPSPVPVVASPPVPERLPVVAPPALVAVPADWQEAQSLPVPVPVSHLAGLRDRIEPEATFQEGTLYTVLAGLVVFFSLAIGLAMMGGGLVSHLSLPGGEGTSLVSPWRAWLAIVAGVGGVAVATAIAARRHSAAAALRTPRIGLGGLAVTGIGLLGGSIVTAGAGGVVLVSASVLGAFRRT